MNWLNDKSLDFFIAVSINQILSLCAAILSCAVLLVASGCSDSDPARERAQKLAQDNGPIQLSMIGDFSGPGGPMLKGMGLALEEINSGKGLLGRKIMLQKNDIKNTAKDALEASQSVADNTLVSAAVSRFTPEVGMPSAVLLQYYGLLHFCTVSSHTRITRQGFDKAFKIVPDDLRTVEFLARFCAKKHFKNIIILQSDDEYGRDMANRFENAAKNAGVTILERMIYNVVNTENEIKRDLELWRDQVKEGAILLLGVPQYAQPVLRLIDEMNLKAPVLGTSALDEPEIFKAAGDETIYVRTYFNPQSQTGLVKKFVQDYTRKNGTPPTSQAGIGYDAVKLFSWAAAKAGTTDPEKLARLLHGDEHFTGLAGKFRFDRHGNFSPSKIYFRKQSGNRTEYLVHNIN
ncbi:ABC transporter substrate-binding protein [Desulfovibrio sp. JC010]|uniref:ABC transporter substrate-binding protein n=1 Tax=Desulfovibrio sp. JC010 TaxID=2593641 RepID=UPI0013D7576E|nr:ABC transporter substrate-binding protein [Desulfovibrio sp. JC010]NDV27672.1 ABC transporter substrate-binding protein [Desulfovibrio sp. JC010]